MSAENVKEAFVEQKCICVGINVDELLNSAAEMNGMNWSSMRFSQHSIAHNHFALLCLNKRAGLYLFLPPQLV